MTDTIYPIPTETQNKVLHRLRRIEGQIRGIVRMVEEERDCRQVVNQVVAVKAALTSLNTTLLECYVRNCLDDPECTSERARDKTVEELIDMIRARDKTVEELMNMVVKATR